jgi:NTP pyrophosphatase (non-canonical NTP hydrolase)
MPTATARGTGNRASIRTFAEFQAMVERTDERKKVIISLLGLVSELGDLNATFKKLVLQRASPTLRSDLREELGDILWYLASIAALHKIPLQEIARESARKAERLYLQGGVNRFDDGFDDEERLPRRFSVTFSEKRNGTQVLVRILVQGVIVGDTLTDNAHKDDGYRYHDVFHLAYAAVLGWSPVVRSLLRRKRKSDARIDEVEDGGRAMVVEEAISILVFNEAPEREWFGDESSVDIGLLKAIIRLTAGLEVQRCTAKQWKAAILQGYAAFNQLQKHRGGRVDVDLDQQSLQYFPLGGNGVEATR